MTDMGGTPIAGWFLMEHPVNMDDFRGTSIFKEPHQMKWPRLWDTPASCWLGMLKHYYEPKPLKPLSVRIKSRWVFYSPDESLKLACRPATGFAAGFENGLYHPFTVIWGMVYIFLFNPHCPKPGVQHHVPTFNSTPGVANCREFFWAPIAAVDEGRATTNQKQYQKQPVVLRQQVRFVTECHRVSNILTPSWLGFRHRQDEKQCALRHQAAHLLGNDP